MIKLEQKQVKIISLLIAAIFVGSVVALALTQSGSGIVSAASSAVGVIDYRQVMSQHPKLATVQAELNQKVDAAQKDFEERAKSMNEQEQQDYYVQTRQRLAQQEQEAMEPLYKNVEEAVKKVADSKGLSVVLAKEAVVYGGQDITQDVIGKLK